MSEMVKILQELPGSITIVMESLMELSRRDTGRIDNGREEV